MKKLLRSSPVILFAFTFFATLVFSGCEINNAKRSADAQVETSSTETPARVESMQSPEVFDMQDDGIHTNPQSLELIVPNGRDLYNNGGTAIQYGDCFYFYAKNENPQNAAFEHAIYVKHMDEEKKYKLMETYHSGNLYVVDDNIITSNYKHGKVLTYRINTRTCEVDYYFLYGFIEYVDYEEREIYFSPCSQIIYNKPIDYELIADIVKWRFT